MEILNLFKISLILSDGSLLAGLLVTGSLALYLTFHYLGIYFPAVADSLATLNQFKQFPLAWLLCGLNLWQFQSNAVLR